MSDPTIIKQQVFAAIDHLLEDKSVPVTDEMALIGDASALDSMMLVELCLALEDMASNIGFEFDWTSDTAMSRSRGMFRSAGALAAEFISQMQAKQ